VQLLNRPLSDRTDTILGAQIDDYLTGVPFYWTKLNVCTKLGALVHYSSQEFVFHRQIYSTKVKSLFFRAKKLIISRTFSANKYFFFDDKLWVSD
jgi:hypothetical protein